jgi:hypothetical protein
VKGSNTETPILATTTDWLLVQLKMSSETTTVNGMLDDEEQQAKDLKVLALYVKDNLFDKCKFVYAEEDLRYDGVIYRHYKRSCKDGFGSGRFNGSGNNNIDVYMRILWEEALKAKIQKKMLAQKRSAVYTVMANKFSGTMSSTSISTKLW